MLSVVDETPDWRGVGVWWGFLKRKEGAGVRVTDDCLFLYDFFFFSGYDVMLGNTHTHEAAAFVNSH